jgi:hypothetical protein
MTNTSLKGSKALGSMVSKWRKQLIQMNACSIYKQYMIFPFHVSLGIILSLLDVIILSSVWIPEELLLCSLLLPRWHRHRHFYLIWWGRSPYFCSTWAPIDLVAFLWNYSGTILNFLLPPKVPVFGGKVTWTESIKYKSTDAPLVNVTALWHFLYYLLTFRNSIVYAAFYHCNAVSNYLYWASNNT